MLSKSPTEEEVRASLKAGCILHSYCNFIENPKEKFYVVVCADLEDELLLVLIINSEIPSFIEHDPHLKSGQIELDHTIYKFFTHKSYINCIDVRYGLDLDFCIHHLLENPKDHKGFLRNDEIQKVIAYINDAQTISDIDKEIVLRSLTPKRTGD